MLRVVLDEEIIDDCGDRRYEILVMRYLTGYILGI